MTVRAWETTSEVGLHTYMYTVATCTCTHTHTNTYTHIHAHTQMYTQIYYAHVHTQIYIYYVYAFAHIHMQINFEADAIQTTKKPRWAVTHLPEHHPWGQLSSTLQCLGSSQHQHLPPKSRKNNESPGIWRHSNEIQNKLRGSQKIASHTWKHLKYAKKLRNFIALGKWD